MRCGISLAESRILTMAEVDTFIDIFTGGKGKGSAPGNTKRFIPVRRKNKS